MKFARQLAVVGLSFTIVFSGCTKKALVPVEDHPRLTPNVRLQDVTFHSTALNRDARYRVILPNSTHLGAKLPVVYLLHGGGGTYRDWSNYSDIAGLAEHNVILVMPEGDESYYSNSVDRKFDRYEDYVVNDLISDVEHRLPADSSRASRAIVGVSMGGFGAIKIGLKFPELFGFVAGLSAAVDVPSRPFNIRRIQQWRYHKSIFGPMGSDSRRRNDPFVLARAANPTRTPFFFLTCGSQEGLLPANQQFGALLKQRGFQYEFRKVAGGHSWEQWNQQVPAMIQSLSDHSAIGR